MSRARTRIPLAALAVIVVAGLLAGCGGSSNDGPGQVLDNATFQGIESAAVDLSIDASAKGEGGGELAVASSGAFQSQGEDKLPRLDFELTAKGDLGERDIDFDGALVLLPDSAYVTYEGVRYEVDPTTFGFIQTALKRAEAESGGEGSAACREAFGELEVSSFVNDLSDAGSADVGGVETTVVKGELDVPRALEAVLGVARGQACQGFAALGPLLSEGEIGVAEDEVSEAVKSAEAEVYVGDDEIVRRIVATIAIEPRDRKPGDPKRVEVDLDLQLTEVNEPQPISAPRGPSQPIGRLLGKLGVNPLDVLGLISGETGPESLGGLLEGVGGGR